MKCISYCFLIIIIKLEVWTIAPRLGLGRETMVCAVCLSIFLLELRGQQDDMPVRQSGSGLLFIYWQLLTYYVPHAYINTLR